MAVQPLSDLPQATRAELADWNARVRRLARDYDPKYRPVVLVVGYRTDLSDGSMRMRVPKIAAATARYTDNRKPLSRATVFRHLAEMEAAGALKTDPRFDPSTGRQRSSIRILNVRVAIRFGQPVEHLWDAPLPADETPVETPGETPDETPISISDLSKELPNDYITPGCARDDGVAGSTEDQGQGQGQDQAGHQGHGDGDWPRTEDRARLAGLLGVPLGSIGSTLWAYLRALADEDDALPDPVDGDAWWGALAAAARRAAGGDTSQVGLFRKIVAGYIALARAERDAQRQAEAEEADRLARAEHAQAEIEIEAFRPQWREATGGDDERFDWLVQFLPKVHLRGVFWQSFSGTLSAQRATRPRCPRRPRDARPSTHTSGHPSGRERSA